MDITVLQNRFIFHPPSNEDIKNNYAAIRDRALQLALYINELAPDSREKDNAIDSLDAAVMWANAAIARGDVLERVKDGSS